MINIQNVISFFTIDRMYLRSQVRTRYNTGLIGLSSDVTYVWLIMRVYNISMIYFSVLSCWTEGRLDAIGSLSIMPYYYYFVL